MTEKKIIGDAGEEFATMTLADKGYIILYQNYTCRTGEIDVIAKDGDTFVFVEVKTRKSNNYGNPVEFVDYWKQKKIRSAAMHFLRSDMIDARFDIFEIIYEMKNGEFLVVEYNHIENAF